MNPEPITKASGLTKRALAGTGWSTISTAGRQVLTIASVSTVARLLGPRAYGLIGMAVIVIGFVSNFRDLGTAVAIVQRPTVSRRLLSSLFWINVLFGLLLALLVSGTAPLTAVFFHTPELTRILQVLSLALVLASCGVVHNALLTRDMSFKALGLIDLLAAGTSFAVALSGALTGLGVWSLVFASVANSVVSSGGYFVAARFRPRFEFDWVEVKSIARFSSNLAANGIVNYGYRNADNLIVGRFLGSTQLGFYQMAYNLMLTPISNISQVLCQVLFPAFARIQDDNARFRHAYIRACSLIALITFPIMAGLGVVADPMIRAILGTKWLETIPIFQVLSVVGLVQSVQTSVGILYQAKGRTDWMFRWNLVVLGTAVAAFLVGVHFGAIGVAAAYAITTLALVTLPGFLIPFSLIGLKMKDFGVALLPQFLVTASMALVCEGWLLFLTSMQVKNAWIRLLTASVLGAAVYIAGILTARPRVIEYLEEVMDTSDHVIVMRGLSFLRLRRANRLAKGSAH
jgi:O-antigen/teichoic acid export membrane protein